MLHFFKCEHAFKINMMIIVFITMKTGSQMRQSALLCMHALSNIWSPPLTQFFWSIEKELCQMKERIAGGLIGIK